METVAITKSVEAMFAVATQSKGWLKFLGVLSIIGGVLSALTIVGILVAWLPIWMGVLLFQAGSQADGMATTQDPNRLVVMLNKLRTYFVIQGVLALIALVGFTLALMISGTTIFSLLNALRR
jgi:hypothetical protein